MKSPSAFAVHAGHQVRVIDPQAMGPLFMRVLAEGEVGEEALADFLGDSHPRGEIEEGYRVVAVEGEIEEGEIRGGGFIAVNENDDRAYLCDSGTIRFFEGPASEIKIEADSE